MAPVRGSKKKRKVEKKGEQQQEGVASGASEDGSADWWAVLSKRVAGEVFISLLFCLAMLVFCLGLVLNIQFLAIFLAG